MKSIFIGIDVSKEKLDASVVRRQNGDDFIVKLVHEVFENAPRGYRKMVSWVKKVTGAHDYELLFCVETTGCYDIPMCNYMYEKDISVWREHALNLKLSIGLKRGKNDVSDSWDIAEYTARNVDKAVFYKPVDSTIKGLKALLNHRAEMVEHKKALDNRLKSYKVAATKDDPAAKYILKDIQQQIKDLNRRVRECMEQIEEIIDMADTIHENYEILTSIPGIGPINAITMIAYTNNFTDFDSANKVASYFGVASFRIQSGTSVDHRAPVRHYSCPRHKSYLSEAALAAIVYNPRLKAYYQRLKLQGKPGGITLNNVKNKLLHIAFSMVKHRTFYDNDYEMHRVMEQSA